MSLSPLKARLFGAGRQTLAAALGLGFAAAIAVQPMQALAQAAPAPAPAQAPAAEAPPLREAPRAQGPGPALWVVRDADSTLYLFGTVHVLRPTTAWGSDKIDAAFDSADEVWLEITNPDDTAAMVPLVQQHGLSLDRPLSTRLTAEELAQVDAAAKTIGTTAAQFEPMKPWIVALTLAVAPLTKAGYDPQSGVELMLRPRAVAAGKEVRGFETLDEQIRILAGLSDEAQLGFLRYTLEVFDEATQQLDDMVEAWAEGDVETLERVGVEEMKEQGPEIYKALLVDRNTNWAGQIEQILAGSGTAFIAVGAAHLAGDDSVQEILEDRGVEVTRVE